MIISRVKLRNWKNFPEVDVQLGRRVFIVGPNASGKSNFLDVFRFLHDIVRSGGGLKKAISGRGGVPKIRCLSAKRVSQVEIEIDLANGINDPPEWTYAIGFRQQSRGHRDPELIYERVHHHDRVVRNRPDDEDLRDRLLLTQTHLEQLGKNVEFRQISDFFGRIHYSHLVPQVLRHPEAFKGPVLDEDPFGRTFLERVAETPEKTRERRLRKIEEALGLAVPQLKNLHDSKDSRGVPHLEAIYEHWRPNDAGKQSEEQFSDGTLRLIGFLWNLLENDDVLLMEEPELSLHVGIIRHLPGLIWRLKAKKRQQILLSTHSADLLSDSSIDAQEVLMLTPGAEGTKIMQASKAADVKNLLDAGFSISEAVISRTEPERAYQLSVFDE